MQVWLAPKPLPVTVHEAFASSSPQHPDLCSSFSGTLSPNTLQGSPFHVPWALTVESLSYHSMNFILILPFAAHWENNQPMKKKPSSGEPFRCLTTPLVARLRPDPSTPSHVAWSPDHSESRRPSRQSLVYHFPLIMTYPKLKSIPAKSHERGTPRDHHPHNVDRTFKSH